jgi:SPP1 family predicted phage head-tail adaptor
MDSRKRDQRITLQMPTISRDSDGIASPSWVDVAIVWAARAHKSSREFYAAQKINSETQEVFNIQYRSDINETWQVVHWGKTYDVLGAPPDNKRTEINLLCKAVS